MKRLAIVTTHPIQYNAPWFKLLAERRRIAVKVFYTWGQLEQGKKFDPGFGKNVEWDIPLTEGYDFTFVNNTASNPGTHHFQGIVNPTLNNEIRIWKPDAILIFGWNFNSHLKCLRYFSRKIPIMFRGDSTLLDEQPGIKRVLRRMFLRWVYSHVDIALFVGINNKKYFIAHGFSMDRLIYAPHAIDNSRFSEPDDFYNNEALILKKNIGIKENDLVILFAGKLEEKKNPLFAISLLKSISDSRLKLVFVGSGSQQQKIWETAATDNRVIAMDFQNQLKMPVIYRLADLFILPSSGPGETWGLSLNEAMASGRAVVASDKTGSAPDLISEGVNGIIMHAENSCILKGVIEKSLNDKSLLKGMGKQSMIKIQSFTFNHIVSAIESFFEK